jgi:cysteine sulfinate desulfinase/cysteine desulfurase-like protein
MTAMNLPPEVIDGSFRVSICRDTSKEELDKLVEVIRSDILPRVRH